MNPRVRWLLSFGGDIVVVDKVLVFLLAVVIPRCGSRGIGVFGGHQAFDRLGRVTTHAGSNTDTVKMTGRSPSPDGAPPNLE